MRSTLCLFVLALVAPTTARAEHRGFTGAIAANGGATHLTANAVNPDTTEPGVGYTLTLGWFAKPQLAIGIHANVLFAPWAENVEGNAATVSFGPVLQYWPIDRLSLLGGVGISVAHFRPKDPMSIEQAISLDSGFAPLLGVSYYPFGDYGVRVSVEAAPMLGGDGLEGFMGSASLGWQFLRAPKPQRNVLRSGTASAQ